jgi:hypothetical protein
LAFIFLTASTRTRNVVPKPTGSRANDHEAVRQPLREAKLSAQVAQPLNPTVGFHFFNRIHSDENVAPKPKVRVPMTAKRFTDPFAKRSRPHKWRQPLNPTVGNGSSNQKLGNSFRLVGTSLSRIHATSTNAR